MLLRPVQKLIPFEIVETDSGTVKTGSDIVEPENEQKEDEDQGGRDEQVVSTRPTRKAAIEGQNLRRLRELYR